MLKTLINCCLDNIDPKLLAEFEHNIPELYAYALEYWFFPHDAELKQEHKQTFNKNFYEHGCDDCYLYFKPSIVIPTLRCDDCDYDVCDRCSHHFYQRHCPRCKKLMYHIKRIHNQEWVGTIEYIGIKRSIPKHLFWKISKDWNKIWQYHTDMFGSVSRDWIPLGPPLKTFSYQIEFADIDRKDYVFEIVNINTHSDMWGHEKIAITRPIYLRPNMFCEPNCYLYYQKYKLDIINHSSKLKNIILNIFNTPKYQLLSEIKSTILFEHKLAIILDPSTHYYMWIHAGDFFLGSHQTHIVYFNKNDKGFLRFYIKIYGITRNDFYWIDVTNHRLFNLFDPNIHKTDQGKYIKFKKT